MSELIIENLNNILDSIELIEERFPKIPNADDFINTHEGLNYLDGISMRLQFIGETLRRIEKIDKSLFENYPEVEWSKIINLRNFISHHYDMLNHQIIYNICKHHIPPLKITINKILSDLH